MFFPPPPPTTTPKKLQWRGETITQFSKPPPRDCRLNRPHDQRPAKCKHGHPLLNTFPLFSASTRGGNVARGRTTQRLRKGEEERSECALGKTPAGGAREEGKHEVLRVHQRGCFYSVSPPSPRSSLRREEVV